MWDGMVIILCSLHSVIFFFWLLCFICRRVNSSKTFGYNIRAANLCNALKTFEVQNNCLSENCVIPVYTDFRDYLNEGRPILSDKQLVGNIRNASLLDGQKFILKMYGINEYRKVYGRNDMYVWNKSMTYHMGAGAASGFVVFLMCIIVNCDAKLYSIWQIPVVLCASFSILCHAIINVIQVCILPLQISCFFNKLSWELIMCTDVSIATYMKNDPENNKEALQIKKPISLMSSDIATLPILHYIDNTPAGNTDNTHLERDAAFKRAKYVENMSIKTHNKISDEHLNVVGYSIVGILLLVTVVISSNFFSSKRFLFSRSIW